MREKEKVIDCETLNNECKKQLDLSLEFKRQKY